MDRGVNVGKGKNGAGEQEPSSPEGCRAFVRDGSPTMAGYLISNSSREGNGGNGAVGRTWYQKATERMSCCPGR